MREIALWNFVNGEAINEVRPWVITNENEHLVHKSAKVEATVYAFLTRMARWRLGRREDNHPAVCEVTPANGRSPSWDNRTRWSNTSRGVPKTTWIEDAGGLHITAYRAQRLYTDRGWPDPIVLKMTNVEPAYDAAASGDAARGMDAGGRCGNLARKLANMGNVERWKWVSNSA